MRFVIIRDDGKYLADMRLSPDGHSYTNKLQYAKVFFSREDALKDKCGNESIIER